MNRFSALSAIVLLSLGLASAEYQLVWQEEFNGNKLDTNTWQYENHCAPQNNELQCYTNRESNVYVKDGFLHVLAKPENYGGKKYTSGRINTKKSAAWKYGRFDIRAKLPKGDYLWPALWMLPRDYVYGGWAASGEIDIMEARGQKTNQVSNALHHGGAWPNNAHVGSGAMDFPFDFTAGFHIFSAIWERDQIQFLVDGKVVTTQSLTRNWYSGRGPNPYNAIRQPFDQPFFFLINVAIGGNFFGAQSQALNTQIAQGWASPELVVDYIRVYQQNGNPVVNPVPAPAPTSAKVTSAVKTSNAATSAKTSSAVKTSATSNAATSAKTSATSNAATSVKASSAAVTSKTAVPATSASSACSGKCGGEGCCNDQKIGVVCYNTASYICANDSNGKQTLCGKGLGACSAVCYNSANYKCVNGALQQN